MEKTYNDIVAENQALKKEIERLRKENDSLRSEIVGMLRVAKAFGFNVPYNKIEDKRECKIICINHYRITVMEKTYNDIVAENQALKRENAKLKREIKKSDKSADGWKEMYNKVFDKWCIAEHEVEKLKKLLEDEQIITDAIATKFGVSADPIRNDFARVYGTDVKQPRECMIISINPVNK